MLCLFVKEYGRVHIDYLTKDIKMDLTHNVGTCLRIIEWFSEAQLLYLTVSNYKEVVCLFSDSCKKQILWNYDFCLFEDEIRNMNKTCHIDFHA